MVIGVDPGTNRVGFAIVAGTRENPKILDYGLIETKKRERSEMPYRLLEIGQDFQKILDTYKPTKAVVEDIFFFKNQKTIVEVAQSRGLLLYLLVKFGLQVNSLTPLQIKQNLCGYGRATKSQIQIAVKNIFKLNSLPKPDDAADSLAMAWLGL